MPRVVVVPVNTNERTRDFWLAQLNERPLRQAIQDKSPFRWAFTRLTTVNVFATEPNFTFFITSK